jgi:hypothetical protein
MIRNLERSLPCLNRCTCRLFHSGARRWRTAIGFFAGVAWLITVKSSGTQPVQGRVRFERQPRAGCPLAELFQDVACLVRGNPLKDLDGPQGAQRVCRRNLMRRHFFKYFLDALPGLQRRLALQEFAQIPFG